MFTLDAKGEAWYLMYGSWVHESLTDVVYSMKEEMK